MPAHHQDRKLETAHQRHRDRFGFGATRPFITVSRPGAKCRSELRCMESQHQLPMARAMGEVSFKTGLPYPMAMLGLANS